MRKAGVRVRVEWFSSIQVVLILRVFTNDFALRDSFLSVSDHALDRADFILKHPAHCPIAAYPLPITSTTILEVWASSHLG